MASADNTSVRHGLRTTLLAWFLVISLVPLGLVGFTLYQSARNSIQDAVASELAASSRLETRIIRSHFDRWMDDLARQSRMESNISFLERCAIEFERSGISPGKSMAGGDWAPITESYREELGRYPRVGRYHDIFLIDVRGNILFALKNEFDPGVNLITGPYRHTRFGEACRKALRRDHVVFSDLGAFSPLSEGTTGFLVASIRNESGERIGLQAFQLSNEQIASISSIHPLQCGGGETYVIGSDLCLRSSTQGSTHSGISFDKVDTEQTRLWYSTHVGIGLETHSVETPFIYTGRNGVPVLGVHSNLPIAGINLAVISEIETSKVFAPANRLGRIVALMLGFVSCLVLLIALVLSRRITRPILRLIEFTQKVSTGRLDQAIDMNTTNEIGALAHSFNKMLSRLREATENSRKKYQLEKFHSELSECVRGDRDLDDLGSKILGYLARQFHSHSGIFYVADRNRTLKPVAGYAQSSHCDSMESFRFGEGLIGQAAIEKKSIHLNNLRDDFMRIQSGLCKASPHSLMIVPIVHNNIVKSVIELASLTHFSKEDHHFMESASEVIAIAVASAESRANISNLLDETRRQAEALQQKQNELSLSNKELETNTAALIESEAKLRTHQSELNATNKELATRTAAVEYQRDRIQQKNMELQNAQQEIEEKAKALEESSRYKSEFLANMSHELRTPLNSMLILSKVLTEDPDGNLSEKQVKAAETILNAGSNLLALINDILDLSKVEAGHLEIRLEDTPIRAVAEHPRKIFKPIAEKNSIEFSVEVDKDLPETLYTDRQRLDQIMNNLLGNAFKFTRKGNVRLRVFRPPDSDELRKHSLDRMNTIAFCVSDTGIGISDDQKKTIFNAFHQTDGSTNRQYGGTGLGLSISRELSALLGGGIAVESSLGKGSCFTVYLPLQSKDQPTEDRANPPERLPDRTPIFLHSEKETIPDARPVMVRKVQDNEEILKNKKVLLVGDDVRNTFSLSTFLLKKGMKTVIATNGGNALDRLHESPDTDIIVMDVIAHKRSEHEAMQEIRCRPRFRDLPIIALTAKNINIDHMECIRSGASECLIKPVNTDRLLSLIRVWIQRSTLAQVGCESEWCNGDDQGTDWNRVDAEPAENVDL